MMARPTLVMDFSCAPARAGVFIRGGALVCDVEAPPEADDTKAVAHAMLEGLKAQGYAGFSRVAVGLPPSLMSMRVMETPFSETRKIEAVAPFEVGEGLLKGPEDYVFKAVAVSDGRALIAAVEREGLRLFLDGLRESGIDPQFVSSPLFFKHGLFERGLGEGETVAFIDRTSVSVVRGGTLVLSKPAYGPADIELVRAALSGEGIEIKRFFCTRGGAGLVKEGDVETLEHLDDGTMGIHAVFHGFRRTKAAPNFRVGEFADEREALSRKRAFVLAGALAASICVAWGLHVYLSLKNLDLEMKRINEGLASGYRAVFGADAVPSGDPLYELEARHKALGIDRGFAGGGQSALDLMKRLSEASVRMEKGKEVRFKKIGFVKKRLVLDAETADFESASRFRDALAATPGFKDIALSDVKNMEGSRVSFTLALTFDGVRG